MFTWLVVGINLFTATIIGLNAWFDIKRYRLMAQRELIMLRRVHDLEMMVYTLKAEIDHQKS